jgi:hypothetical protein
MQQPIRYYITKSGEEPTVRSVKVARGVDDAADRDELDVKRASESQITAPNDAERRRSVKRLVAGAIRKRAKASCPVDTTSPNHATITGARNSGRRSFACGRMLGMDVDVPASPLVDHVIATFSRDALSAALAAIHRAGFGPHSRVLDGARADAAQQLARTGLHMVTQTNPEANALLIVVTAPGRTAIVSDLFVRLGAVAIWFASRKPIPEAVTFGVDPIVPDIRISGDTAHHPET